MLLAPTAAIARPCGMKFPAKNTSTVLYICWIKLLPSSGNAKRIKLFTTDPCVRLLRGFVVETSIGAPPCPVSCPLSVSISIYKIRIAILIKNGKPILPKFSQLAHNVSMGRKKTPAFPDGNHRPSALVIFKKNFRNFGKNGQQPTRFDLPLTSDYDTIQSPTYKHGQVPFRAHALAGIFPKTIRARAGAGSAYLKRCKGTWRNTNGRTFEME